MSHATFLPPDLTTAAGSMSLGWRLPGSVSPLAGRCWNAARLIRMTGAVRAAVRASSAARHAASRARTAGLVADDAVGEGPPLQVHRVRPGVAAGHLQNRAAPGEDLSTGLRWALEGIVCQHLTVARVAEGLGVSWHTANSAILAEGKSPADSSVASWNGTHSIRGSALRQWSALRGGAWDGCHDFGILHLWNAGLDALATAVTVGVPGFSPLHDPPAAVCEALRRAAANGARVVSVCTGAFALAAAGLDGKRATTHSMNAQLLQRLHPAVTLDPEVLYVDDGTISTSAGGPWHRPVPSSGPQRVRHGGCHPHRPAWLLRPTARAARPNSSNVPLLPRYPLRPNIAWDREHMAEPLSVADLAAHDDGHPAPSPAGSSQKPERHHCLGPLASASRRHAGVDN